MRTKEYAVKVGGTFIQESDTFCLGTRVKLFTLEEAKEEVRWRKLTYVCGELVPQAEIFVRDVETRVSPWRKRK